MPAKSRRHHADYLLFWGLLWLIVVAPLPLGGNRPWVWNALQFGIFSLAAFWLIGYGRGRYPLTPAFNAARPALWLLWGWVLYGGVRLLPWPQPWVEWLAPGIAAFYLDAWAITGQAGGWMPLTLDHYLSSVEWLKSIAYALIFSLTLLLAHTRTRIQTMVVVLVHVGLLQALYASLTAATEAYRFATGTFVNRNHFAGYMEMMLALGIGLLIAQLQGVSNTGRGWRQQLRHWLTLIMGPKMRLRAYLVVMVIALVLTHSRMGNSAFFLSLLIAGGIGLFLSRHATRSVVILLISLIVIDIFIVGAWFGIDQVAERVQQTSVKSETRVQVDNDMVGILRDFPIFGSGAGTFETIYVYYKAPAVGALNFDHAHNDYLEIASDHGLIGFALLAGVVLLSFYQALRAQRLRHEPLLRGIAFSATMGIIAIMIHSTVDFNLQIPGNAILFMFILALAWIAAHALPHSTPATAHSTPDAPKRKKHRRRPPSKRAAMAAPRSMAHLETEDLPELALPSPPGQEVAINPHASRPDAPKPKKRRRRHSSKRAATAAPRPMAHRETEDIPELALPSPPDQKAMADPDAARPQAAHQKQAPYSDLYIPEAIPDIAMPPPLSRKRRKPPPEEER